MLVHNLLRVAVLVFSVAACASSGRIPPNTASDHALPADLPPPRRTVHVASLAELGDALSAALPGDHLVLQDGAYRTSEPIRIGRSGRSGSPLVIRGAHVGGAEIAGTHGFGFTNSDHVVIYGFRFTHGSTQEIPEGSDHVRIARNEFELADSVRHWLRVSGNDVEVDHNTFRNKSTQGVYLAVDGPEHDMAKRTWIHHNYFYNHQFDGANGGESVRLGLSWRSLWSAYATVEHNLFERADGDAEAISNKSSDNVIRGNTIRDSEGCIVLRHGNRTTVSDNFILDSGCGLRIYGNDHRIVHNYVADNSGPALTIGSGMVRDHEAQHSPEERRGYDAAERVEITYNTFVGNERGIVGEDRTHPPKDNRIAHNVLAGPGAPVVFGGNTPVAFEWEANLFVAPGAREPVVAPSDDGAIPEPIADSETYLRVRSSHRPSLGGATPSVPVPGRSASWVPRRFGRTLEGPGPLSSGHVGPLAD